MGETEAGMGMRLGFLYTTANCGGLEGSLRAHGIIAPYESHPHVRCQRAREGGGDC